MVSARRAAAAAVALMLHTPAFAQVTTADIVGRVDGRERRRSARRDRTHGAHNLKIGSGVVSRRFRQFQSASAVGTIAFTTALTDNGAGSGGNSIASFLLGYPATVARTHTLFDPHYRTTEPSVYVQDDWRATSWLTLNAGVRYDVFTPLTEEGNHLSNIDITALKLLVAGENGVSESAGVKTDTSNLAPR